MDMEFKRDDGSQHVDPDTEAGHGAPEWHGLHTRLSAAYAARCSIAESGANVQPASFASISPRVGGAFLSSGNVSVNLNNSPDVKSQGGIRIVDAGTPIPGGRGKK